MSFRTCCPFRRTGSKGSYLPSGDCDHVLEASRRVAQINGLMSLRGESVLMHLRLYLLFFVQSFFEYRPSIAKLK